MCLRSGCSGCSGPELVWGGPWRLPRHAQEPSAACEASARREHWLHGHGELESEGPDPPHKSEISGQKDSRPEIPLTF